MTLTTSGCSTRLDCRPEQAWAVVANGRPGPRWYVDAAPLVFRAALDRVVGGTGTVAAPPDRDVLRTGDRAGFWEVTDADHVHHALELTALVKAPGTVVLTTTVEPTTRGCLLRQSVRLDPDGLAGAAYLLVDLPARALVMELTQRRLVADVRAAVAGRVTR